MRRSRPRPDSPFPKVPRLTPRIVARWLHVRVHRVHEWIRDGELPAFNVTTTKRPRWRLYEHDVRSFLEKRDITIPD